MRRTKQDAEQTRKAILASAMDIFYEKGYSKTTFDEIAKRINLTKGAVYWYFRNKPDIVAALINEFAVKYFTEINAFINSRKTISFDNITDTQLFIFQMMHENLTLHKFMFFITCQMEWSEAIINKVLPAIEETKKISRNLMFENLRKLRDNGVLKPDTDIVLTGEILMTISSGALEAYFGKRLTNDLETVIRNGFTMVYNNIKTEGNNNEN